MERVGIEVVLGCESVQTKEGGILNGLSLRLRCFGGLLQVGILGSQFSNLTLSLGKISLQLLKRGLGI